jgi:hypothetical protein
MVGNGDFDAIKRTEVAILYVSLIVLCLSILYHCSVLNSDVSMHG